LKQYTKTEALLLVAQLQFREFTHMDNMTFQGCDSDNPLIAETDDAFVIVDDKAICILPIDGDDDSHQLFVIDEKTT